MVPYETLDVSLWPWTVTDWPSGAPGAPGELVSLWAVGSVDLQAAGLVYGLVDLCHGHGHRHLFFGITAPNQNNRMSRFLKSLLYRFLLHFTLFDECECV